MALSNKWRKIALYFLPGDALNEALPFLLTAYTTVLIHLRSQAVSDSLNAVLQVIAVNNTIVNVSSISNAVMWSCRNESNGRSYYKTLYILAFILMLIFSIVSVISALCRPEFWCRKKSSIVRTIAGGLVFDVGLTFLVFSFDISPYSCYLGPERIDYTLPDELVDLTFNQTVVNFIKAAPLVAFSCFIVWFVIIIGSAIYDSCNYEHESDIFEEKEYDSSAAEATGDDDTYYEINYVKTKRTCNSNISMVSLLHNEVELESQNQSQISGVTNTQGSSRQELESQNQNQIPGVTNTQGSSRQELESQNQSQISEVTNSQGSSRQELESQNQSQIPGVTNTQGSSRQELKPQNQNQKSEQEMQVISGSNNNI